MINSILTREWGQQPYQTVWDEMQTFTADRSAETPDEIWFVEHPPVFTQGQAGKAEHIINAKNIPVIQTDRGGQVTYHGPGQLVAYILVDVKRHKMTVRQLVTAIEQAVIDMLATLSITALAKRTAPGVYVNDAKICSIGLRIRRGCSYHGLALNVNMDLSPFKLINPCGFEHLQMTQISEIIGDTSLNDIIPLLTKQLKKQLDVVQLCQDKICP